MAKITVTSTVGSTVYFIIFDSSGNIWNGTSFVTPNSANWSTYAVASSEADTAGVFSATFPAGITPTGVYNWEARTSGGSPAVSDVAFGVGTVFVGITNPIIPVVPIVTGPYLITLAEYKTFYPSGNTDAVVNAMIPVVADIIDTYIDWHLIVNDYTETYDATGNNFLRLKNKPINSITSVTFYYNMMNPVTYDNTFFIIDRQPLTPPSGMIYPNKAISTPKPVPFWFDGGWQSVQVVYNAGYTVANVPAQLKWAAALLINRQILQSQGNQLLSSMTLDQYSETVANGDILSSPDNNDIVRILNRWKSVRYIF
jgi:hypothetical protein